MMNWMADAQNDSDCGIGGWAYGPNWQNWADNSNSGYASLGIGLANMPIFEGGFGIPIPASVITGLDTYITNSQVVGGQYTGGSLYNPCWGMNPGWVNILKTGNLLYEMAIVGRLKTDASVQSAISFIETYWNNPGGVYDGGGWQGDYQAMFTMMKGLGAYGIEKLTVAGSEIDWFDVVSTYIVNNQSPDGSWTGTAGETFFPIIDTPWALLTLEGVFIQKPVFIDIKPGSCPNPLNLKSLGVLPVAVLGTKDFDVTTIDPSTIKLTRKEFENVAVAPIRFAYEDVATPFKGELCACHDLNGDGYLDLTLKFDTQALVSTLNLSAVSGQTVTLTLIGKLKKENGGTRIKGQDCIRVLK